jgi:uncharacterized protein
MLVRFFLLFFAAISLHAEPLPELKTPVTDLTGTLSKEQISNLENRILGLEKEKGSQIAIAIVPTTSAENIEQYSIRLATAWKIGRKGVDDGVLLVVAKQDRKLRIEVGYGLEGAIPDAYAKQIIDMTIVPRLREGKFYEGISDGLDRIISLIKTESLPPAQKEKAIPRMSNTEWMLAVLIHGGFWLRPALLLLGVILFIWKRDLKGLVISLLRLPIDSAIVLSNWRLETGWSLSRPTGIMFPSWCSARRCSMLTSGARRVRSWRASSVLVLPSS